MALDNFSARAQVFRVLGGGELPTVYFDTGLSDDAVGTEGDITFEGTIWAAGSRFLVLNLAGSDRPTIGGSATCVMYPSVGDDGPFILEVTVEGDITLFTNGNMAVMPVNVFYYHPQPPF